MALALWIPWISASESALRVVFILKTSLFFKFFTQLFSFCHHLAVFDLRLCWSRYLAFHQVIEHLQCASEKLKRRREGSIEKSITISLISVTFESLIIVSSSSLLFLQFFWTANPFDAHLFNYEGTAFLCLSFSVRPEGNRSKKGIRSCVIFFDVTFLTCNMPRKLLVTSIIYALNFHQYFHFSD